VRNDLSDGHPIPLGDITVARMLIQADEAKFRLFPTALCFERKSFLEAKFPSTNFRLQLSLCNHHDQHGQRVGG
jgi:hypothetical protein